MNFRLLIICLLPISLMAQKPDTIPFKLTEANNISVQCILNQIDTLNLMFHTANSGLAMIESSVAQLTTLEKGKTNSVKTWGGDATSQRFENNLLQIGNLSWDSLTIFQDRYSGPGTDGKFGMSFFENNILEIDFDKNHLVIHQYLPEMDEQFQKLDLGVNEIGFLFLEGKLDIGNKTLNRKFLIHSGYGGTILLDDEFVAKHQIGNYLETISESELKDSYGNILKTKKAMLPKLSFGKSDFENIPIGFFEGAIGRQTMSVLGGNVLKRFNWIFDFENEAIYLKTNNLHKDSF